MSKVDHYMPLWIADYLADTTRLTTEQHGAYLLLLMDYWRNGQLPDDDNVLAQITKMEKKNWKKNRSFLVQFFVQKNGFLIHKRVEKELSVSREKKDANIERAKAAAEARWGKDKQDESNASSNANSIDQALHDEEEKQCSTNAISSLITHKHTKNSSKELKGDIVDKEVDPLSPKNHLDFNFDEIKNAWNMFAEANGLAQVRELTKRRKSGIKARLSERGFDAEEIFREIQKSSFLRGKNNRGWKVDFDFVFCSPNKWVNIVEGKYRDNGTSGGKLSMEELWNELN